MIIHILIVVLSKTKYFARLVAVVLFVFAALKYNQTTQLDSLAIHLNTDLSTGTV
jgi:hypothetical protein